MYYWGGGGGSLNVFFFWIQTSSYASVMVPPNKILITHSRDIRKTFNIYLHLFLYYYHKNKRQQMGRFKGAHIASILQRDIITKVKRITEALPWNGQ